MISSHFQIQPYVKAYKENHGTSSKIQAVEQTIGNLTPSHLCYFSIAQPNPCAYNKHEP